MLVFYCVSSDEIYRESIEILVMVINRTIQSVLLQFLSRIYTYSLKASAILAKGRVVSVLPKKQGKLSRAKIDISSSLVKNWFKLSIT